MATLNADWTPAGGGCWVIQYVNDPYTTTALTTDTSNRENQIGRKFDGLMTFEGLGFSYATLTREQWALGTNGMTFVMMSSFGASTNAIPSLASGSTDATWKAMATAIKQLNSVGSGRVFWRFMHEFNLPSSPWNAANYGGNTGTFITAWRRMWTIFFGDQAAWTSLGISGTPIQCSHNQVKFVWSPNAKFAGSGQANDPTPYYPGGSYVDWIGVDAYPFRVYKTPTSLVSPQDGVDGASAGAMDWYATFKSYAKPMMVSETGVHQSGSYDTPDSRTRAQWWSAWLTALKNTYPQVHSIGLWDGYSQPQLTIPAGSIDQPGGPWNHRVDAPNDPSTAPADTGAFAAYKTFVTDAYMNPSAGTTPTTSSPTAAFTFNVAGLTVTVTDHSIAGSSGPITAWRWDWGDGTTSTGQAPADHIYTGAGSYPITLTVTGSGADGQDQATNTATVTTGGGGGGGGGGTTTGDTVIMQRSADGSTNWQDIAGSDQSLGYQEVDADAGQYLRAKETKGPVTVFSNVIGPVAGTAPGPGPGPAPYPSVLKQSGQTIVDANGSVMPLMRGLNIQVVSGWSAQTFLDIYNKGFRMLRTVLFWDSLQPSNGTSVDSTYIATLDAQIQRMTAAGLYTTFAFYYGPQGVHSPTAWGPSGSSAMSAYITYGQFVTQYLANRYGNPSSPQYTPAVIGFGLNEPTPDSSSGSYLTTLMNQQQTMMQWCRAKAPTWMGVLSGAYGNGVLYPNAPGSGHGPGESHAGDQTFTAAPKDPTGGLGNFLIDIHCYFMGTTITDTTPLYDGRGPNGIADNTQMIRTNNTLGHTAYPPVGTRAQCQTALGAYFAPAVAYCAPGYANCPLYQAEFGWPATAGLGGGDNWAADVTNAVEAAGAAAIEWWDYNTSNGSDPYAARPGASAPGAGSDGWQTALDASLAT